MCGLTGFWNRSRDQSAEELLAVVGRMTETLHHRGPDDTGTWCDPASGIALGHQRLSIVDLSPAGHQPMTSACGRFVSGDNGEIYNHPELREQLAAKGHSFRGHSDTEVLIEGFVEWGIVETIQRCIGMFAIAVWDTKYRQLTLIRDRIGKKPLYYGRFGSTLLFGSELKALRAHPAFRGDINRFALGEFLKRSYLPGPSIYRDVTRLRPGCLLTIRYDYAAWWAGNRDEPEQEYWALDRAVSHGQSHPFVGSYEDAVTSLDRLLTDAVGCRMVADVPLGAFLSGGIDSSVVVALMQKQSPRPVKTFTIGFEEEEYNEAPFAKRVAEHLQTDHTELYVNAQQARDVIPRLPTMFDEPFGDSSQIPTFLVSQLARQHVTVSLSGDGGDELFCGYHRYFEGLVGFDRNLASSGGGAVARSVRSRAVGWLRALPDVVRQSLAQTCRELSWISTGRVRRLLQRAANVLSETNPNERYLRNMSHWRADDRVVIGSSIDDGCEIGQDFWPAAQDCSPDELQQIWQWYDTLTYLPGDVLTKVDRAGMAVSLETRVPLLDHRVVEFAWSLPHSFQAGNGIGKRILRSVLAQYVPSELFERPKVGFGVPIDRWLRGPLKDWAEELLDESRLKREGYLNPQPIRQKWAEHLSGAVNWHPWLWDVLMFQAWLAEHRAAAQ